MRGSGSAGIYGGQSAASRRADRRARLLVAAREMWRDEGWTAVTMRGVCARAGLVDRYFYESFPDRDALLVEVWEEERTALVGRALEALAGHGGDTLAVQLRAVIDAVVDHLHGSRHAARIVLGEHTGSPVLEPRRRAMLRTFADLLVDWAGPRLPRSTDPTSLRMSAMLGVGGFAEVISAWNAGELDVDAAQIAEHTATVAALLVGGHLVR